MPFFYNFLLIPGIVVCIHGINGDSDKDVNECDQYIVSSVVFFIKAFSIRLHTIFLTTVNFKTNSQSMNCCAFSAVEPSLNSGCKLSHVLKKSFKDFALERIIFQLD